MKNCVSPVLLAERAIRHESTWISREILRRPELSWIDENADHHRASLSGNAPRSINQRAVPAMQRSHRRNEDERATRRPTKMRGRRNGTQYFQGARHMGSTGAAQVFPRCGIASSKLGSGGARPLVVGHRVRFQPGQSLVVTATLQKMAKLRIHPVRQRARELDDARGDIGQMPEVILWSTSVKFPIGN